MDIVNLISEMADEGCIEGLFIDKKYLPRGLSKPLVEDKREIGHQTENSAVQHCTTQLKSFAVNSLASSVCFKLHIFLKSKTSLSGDCGLAFVLYAKLKLISNRDQQKHTNDMHSTGVILYIILVIEPIRF